MLPNVHSYRRVSYLCTGCKTQRSVIIDNNLHIDREELTTNGLAGYIDIHPNYKTKDQTDHGVKLYIDFNFDVRSNDLLSASGPANRKTIQGLPKPTKAITFKKLMYPSLSWNSLKISSHQHNLGYFVISDTPSKLSQNSEVTNVKSSLGTVNAEINFRIQDLTQANLENGIEWITILCDWIETTASLNTALVPSIIRYIDKQITEYPTLIDQLSIPILLDKSAKLRLRDDSQILEEILKTTIHNPYNVGFFYPSQSVDYESFFIINDKLSKKRFEKMSEITSSIMVESENKDKTSDVFISFFFNLFEKDNIDYRITQLL